jgi:hypothetical protein
MCVLVEHVLHVFNRHHCVAGNKPSTARPLAPSFSTFTNWSGLSLIRHIRITIMPAVESQQGAPRMSELANIVTRSFAHPQEQRRNKLQDALGGIAPAKHQQEIAAALAMDKDRRIELRSKFDELPTDELERMLSTLVQRFGAGKIAESQPKITESQP